MPCSRALALTPEQLGAIDVGTRVLALVMETRFRSAVWATVGLADGTTSLYFGDGRSMLGAGVDETVVATTQAWLQACEESFAHLAPASGDPPLPELGTTAFFALTADGVFAGSIAPAERETHPLLGLWAKGESVRREVLRWKLNGDPEAYAP